jgi:hypothetical protein
MVTEQPSGFASRPRFRSNERLMDEDVRQFARQVIDTEAAAVREMGAVLS